MIPRFSKRFERDSSGLESLFTLSEKKDAISFAGGYPAEELFPKEELDAAFLKRSELTDNSVYQYSSALGYEPLRAKIRTYAKKNGIDCEIENIMITQGAQQGINFLADLFLDVGDGMAVEAPTYIGALEAFAARSPEFYEIEMQDDGLNLDQLEEVCKHHQLKMLYTVPNFQNPTGICMSLAKRKRLAKMASRYDFLVIEDDPYRELRYEGVGLPSIKAFDMSGNVVTLGSCSKILSPALRTGWLIADETLMNALKNLRLASDCNPSSVVGQMIDEYLEDNDINEHIEEINDLYRDRRDAMIDGLKRYLPEECDFTEPLGGFFIWLELPEDVVAQEILDNYGDVTFIESSTLFPVSHRRNCMRLNFTGVNDEEIEEGCRRLGDAIKETLYERISVK
jgi:DNA-binding transcriptional MocR family regulator